MIQSVCLNIKFGGWLRGKWAGYYLLGISFYIENKFGYFYTHTIRPFYYIRTEYKEQTITVISNCWRNISSGERSYRPERGAANFQLFECLLTVVQGLPSGPPRLSGRPAFGRPPSEASEVPREGPATPVNSIHS